MKAALVLAILALAASSVAQPAPWHFVYSPGQDPNLGTLGCYDGSSYPFLYRVGTSGRLSVYLEDGGACWDGIVSCNIPNLFNQNVNLNSVLATLSTRVGLLSDDSRSAIISDSILYLPSCSADFFMGNSTSALGSGQWTGRANVEYALNHVASHIPAPSQVNVIGASFGTAVNAAFVFDKFKTAQAFKVITDSGAGFFNSSQWVDALYTWGMALPSWIPGLSPDNLKANVDNLSAYITSTVAAFYPQATFGIVTSNADAVQSEVYALSGGVAQPSAWPGLMRTALQAEQKNSNVVSFIAPGNSHVLNNATAYWSLESDQVYLFKWINNLLSGSPSMPNVDCQPSC